MIAIAVEIIQKYIQEHLFEPSTSWSKYEFQKRSYSQWAAYEIINRIMDNPLDAPVDTIEKFIVEMAFYACYGEDEHRSWIFQTAAETAEEIILLFV